MKGVGRSSGEEQWVRKRKVTTYSSRSSVFLTLTLLSYMVTVIVCTVEATSGIGKGVQRAKSTLKGCKNSSLT